MKNTFLMLCVLFSVIACKKDNTKSANTTDDALIAEAQTFLDDYTKTFTKLYYDSAEAEWSANTKIVTGDTLNAYHVQKANEAYAKFTGSTEVIEKTRQLLENKNQLDLVQVRQLNTILYAAANNPETVADLVKERIAAENAQNETLFGYDF